MTYRFFYRARKKMVTLLIKHLSPLIRVFENILYAFKTEKSNTSHSPVFIIGAPRTGSTILYQALTNGYNVQYIDNMMAPWYRNLLFGMWCSDRKYKNAPHDNFKADYGNTNGYGERAPHECGNFWYRWLPKERHFIDHDEVTNRMVSELKREVLRAQNFFDRPILFKNLNVGQRLRLISKAFPDAKIIFLRRDPRFIVRSILKARAKLGVKSNDWWSVMPPNVRELKGLPEAEMCAAQVYFLEKQISADLKLFSRSNIKVIHFQHLSQSLLQELATWIGVKTKDKGSIPVFEQDCFAELPQEEQDYLNEIVNCYPFEKDLFF